MPTTGEIDLEADYGITWDMGPASNGIQTIGDEFTVGTDAARTLAARAKYPYWIAYCSCVSNPPGTPTPIGSADRVPTTGAPAWTDAQILACSSFTAAWNDAVLKTSLSIAVDPAFTGAPLSRANIIAPHGSYYVNYPLLVAFGRYTGMGCANYAPDLNTPGSEIQYGTRISVWHEQWLDSLTQNRGVPQRNVFQSINYPRYIETSPGVWTEYVGPYGASGIPGSIILGTFYMEGLTIEGFRINGRKNAAPEAAGPDGNTYVSTYSGSALAIWRPGSNSVFRDLNIELFNAANIEVCSGTPTQFYNVRSFFGNFAGLHMRGDATAFIYGFECDDCPTAFLAGSFTDPDGNILITPGCNITAVGVKLETGLTNYPDYTKGTMLLDATGWVQFTFSGVNYASANIFPELLIRINMNDSSWGDYTGVSSGGSVTGLRTFGNLRTLLHHIDPSGNHKKWMYEGDEYTVSLPQRSAIHSFHYSSDSGGVLTTSIGTAPRLKEVAYDNRQNWLVASPHTQFWDDTVDPGTPIYTNPAS